MTALKVVNGYGSGDCSSESVILGRPRPHLYVVGSSADPTRTVISDSLRRKAELQAAQERAELLAALKKLGRSVLIVATVLSVALICGLVIGYLLSPEVVAGGHYEVASGDTLWDIAQRIKGSRSTADTVALIQELNHLSGSVLRVGQTLIVPAG